MKARRAGRNHNGSEFEVDFARLLDERSIKRRYTYPKTPKMSAHAERFNRTIQESFVDYHEELLFTDLALFNRKLADWLAFYNAERPHHILGEQSPLSSLLKDLPECQRYWTHTGRKGLPVCRAHMAASKRYASAR